MNKKYIFLKKLYKNTLIIFKTNDNYKTINIDKKIMKFIQNEIEEKQIDYIIIDNLTIIEHKKYKKNNYKKYYYITKIKEIIDIL